MFDAATTLWNGNSPLCKLNADQERALVPASGKCDTVEGELHRAAGKIYYDYYNNGFGNNWSGAYNFLDQHFGLTKNERRVLRPYCRGRIVPRKNFMEGALPAVLEGLCERIILHVEMMRMRGFTPNEIDMFSLQEKTDLR